MASCNLCGVEMVGGCAANGCPHRAPQPSVPSGEAVAWGVVDEDGMVTDTRPDEDSARRLASTFHSIAMHESTGSEYRVIPLYAAPPQDRVSEVTEAMVRGECAADGVAERMMLRHRAERAEAERDEAKKDAAMWKDIADMNYRGFKREKAKIADAIIALSAGDGGGEP